jgi:hypothetical protein
MKPAHLLIVIMALIASISAQETALPVDLQFDLMMKVLTFDRSLRSRVGDELVIGVVCQKDVRESQAAKDALLAAARAPGASPWPDLPVRAIALEIGSPAELDSRLGREGVDIVYLASLRAVNIKTVVAVCQARKILSFTGVPAYLEAGASVGFDLREDRPVIIINLAGARRAGADFSSKLLRLIRVIGD